MNGNQIALGVGLIVVAVVVLLANINIGFARELVASWWPIVIVIAGLTLLWNNRNNLAWNLIITGLGIALLISTLGIFGLSFGDVILPILLLAVGVAVIVGAFNKELPKHKSSSPSDGSVSAILGGVNSRNISDDYRGGSVNAVLGGVELDLSKAVIKKEAVIQVWVFMGGVTLRVPEGVLVRHRTMNIIGGIEDKTVGIKDSKAPVLYIDGTVTMGGVEIRN